MIMKHTTGKFFLVILFALIATIQCSTTGFGPQGSLFTSTTIGVHGTGTNAQKSGSACVMSILGLFAFGDGSVKAAATAGGISKVLIIDLEGFSVLSLFSKQCTVVRGD